MACPFKSVSPPIIWFGPVDGKLKTYSDGVNINRNLPNYDRIRTTGDHGNGQYNLKIWNLSLEDAGQYKCHSFENGSVLEAVYHLNILGNNSFFLNQIYSKFNNSIEITISSSKFCEYFCMFKSPNKMMILRIDLYVFISWHRFQKQFHLFLVMTKFLQVYKTKFSDFTSK